MFNSLGRTLVRVLLLAAPIASIPLLSAGCAEALTYANRSREKGIELYRERAYEDAAGAFRNAVRQDPRDWESFYWLGVCYTQMGQHQQAFTQYRTSLDVIVSTLGGMGEDEYRLRIIDAYANAIARHDVNDVEITACERRADQSHKAEDWLLVAKAYRFKGDADKAIDAYTRAAKWDVKSFVIRKDFGLYLLEPLNQREQAEYYLRAANRINNEDPQVIAGLQKLGVTVQAPKSARANTRPPEKTAVARD